ncbi:MAG: zincin-like metallopeptidase domain-containing protein, partial [Acetobacteraceae bacterium]|nr:zincin-like metallopeptidase domain-containing protein [Acetobacteraceae bacterium]
MPLLKITPSQFDQAMAKRRKQADAEARQAEKLEAVRNALGGVPDTVQEFVALHAAARKLTLCYDETFAGDPNMTFRQALSLGGHVRKGERGTTVVYADRFTPDDERRRAAETGEEAQAIPFLKRFTVFNTAQCEGLPNEMMAMAPPVETDLVLPQAEALIRATGVNFRIGGERAFYDPRHDFVQVPPPQAYFEPINWHRTALHEIGHASGHSSRLNRDLTGSFGSKKYAFEELIAEISAAYLCAFLNITPTVRHAD